MGFELSEEEAHCSEALGTPIGAFPMRYLGLQLSGAWLSIMDWQLVIKKVERRLEGWQARIL